MPRCAAGRGRRRGRVPAADVVVGNPPFLGDKKMRAELGDATTTQLRKTYEGRVPGGADLVCYWFDKARAQMAAGALQRAGLVTTNSIRGGANRKVLDAICAQTRIFEAWSDEPWVNEGAAVRVSLVAFGDAEQPANLDGAETPTIHADLTAGTDTGSTLDLSQAKPTNTSGTSFIGTQKGGAFDIPGDVARNWLRQPNPHGRSNADVLAPWINGLDITRRPNGVWIVDFGCDEAMSAAALYELPFHHAAMEVKPGRTGLKRENHAKYWWRHAESRPGMRMALRGLARYIATARVAKHRLFVWQPTVVLPDSQVVVIARADDTTFGILHSRFHELWSLRMCTWLGVGNDPRYTPTTCFETFPFPAGLTPADTAHQRTESVEGGALIPADLPDTLPAENFKPNQPPAPSQKAPAAIKNIAPRQAATAIAQAAQRLSALRQAWLNPPEWTDTVPEVVPLGMATSPYPDRTVPKPGFEKDLAKRTLTNLYNQRPAWLAAAHAQLDTAVAAAYGWADYTADMPDDEILRRLLALNLQRSSGA